MPQTPIAIWIDDDEPSVVSQVEALAQRMGLPIVRSEPAPGAGLVLRLGPGGLSLCDAQQPDEVGYRVDFSDLDPRVGSRDRSRRQPLGRAIGGRAERVVDATAGLGRDTVLLAFMGYSVTAIERCPILAALLREGFDGAAVDHRFAAAVDGRVHVVEGDARCVLPDLPGPVDVVYIDPMYPSKRKTSALAKKRIRLVRALVGDDQDSTDLVAVARRTAGQRVVVKRPPYAEPLVPAPAYTIESKLVRYDVYLGKHA